MVDGQHSLELFGKGMRMVQPTGLSVRILDFGLAIVDLFDFYGNPTGVLAPPAGTFLYMSPEQLNSERLSPACDVYAVD